MEKDYKQFLRDRLTRLRLDKNLSEYQLSLALGKCKTYTQAISSGKSLPAMESFFDICDYFEITPAEFFQEPVKDSPQRRRIRQMIDSLPEDDLALLEQLLKKILR